MTQPTLVIDGHGGDLGPSMILPATFSVANIYPNILFDIIVCSSVIDAASQVPNNVNFIANDCVIDTDSSPTFILKHRRQSTLGHALSHLEKGLAVGCLTAANTGALVALSRHFLSRFNQVKKPVLVKPIPGGSLLLDLGANIDCSADDLVQFAYLGDAFCRATGENEKPSVALLNVGSENHKGTKIIRAAHEQLKTESIDYVGFIEANDLFNNQSQVIVCDGFVGNIALKTSEGLSQYLQSEISRQLESLLQHQSSANGLFKKIKQQMNPGRYNGACLLGLNGLVVKSHGGADQESFAQSLIYLVEQATQNTLSKLQHYWSNYSFSHPL